MPTAIRAPWFEDECAHIRSGWHVWWVNVPTYAAAGKVCLNSLYFLQYNWLRRVSGCIVYYTGLNTNKHVWQHYSRHALEDNSLIQGAEVGHLGLKHSLGGVEGG